MKYRFSGHQTFAFRYGWLEKGVKGVAASPGIFAAEDAIVQLGVGKNMVESIRHWCLATQMLEEKPDPADKQSPASSTLPPCEETPLERRMGPFLGK